MRKFLVLGFILALLVPCASGAAPAAPEIAEVHVFPQGAYVAFLVPAGVFELHLPGTFSPTSLRLDGEAAAVPLDIATLPGDEERPPALADTVAKVAALRNDLIALQAEAESLRQTIKLLDKLELKEAGAVAVVQDAARVRREAEQRLGELGIKIEETSRIFELWRQELDLRTPPGWDRVIRVRGEVPSPTLLRVWTDNATWRHQYAMNLDTKGSAIAGRMRAILSQRTGLLWSCPVFLHTVNPPQSTVPPDVRPLIVDAREKRDEDLSTGAFFSKEASAPMMAAKVEGRADDNVVRQESERGVTISARGSVPGDGREVTLDLGALAMTAKPVIVAVPAVREDAWLLGEIASLDQALLAGECELAIDGIPSGTTFIPERAKGQGVTISFGNSPLVRAKRERHISTEGRSWIGTGRQEDGYTIELTNGLPQAASVRLVDRLPTSRRDDVAVEIVAIEPKPGTEKEGVMTWEFPLDSGMSQKVEVLWRISFPGDKELFYQEKP